MFDNVQTFNSQVSFMVEICLFYFNSFIEFQSSTSIESVFNEIAKLRKEYLPGHHIYLQYKSREPNRIRDKPDTCLLNVLKVSNQRRSNESNFS